MAHLSALPLWPIPLAIDVLYPERRAEGIGYYGLSNNIAMAIGPSAGLYIYTSLHNFNIIFTLSLATAFLGLALVSSVSTRDRVPIKRKTSCQWTGSSLSKDGARG